MSNFLNPLINPIQKIALYETKSNFHLIGSTNDEVSFRVLRISRLQPRHLEIEDDGRTYGHNEISQLMVKIEKENKSLSMTKSKAISAFGILGFVRFHEGFYIVLITKRQKIATVGLHSIYKIENTLMKYIPHDSVRVQHPHEQKYVKMFQNMDLSSNFYFSYSYDVTHTLQHNMNYYTMKSDGEGVQVIRSDPNREFVWNSHLIREIEQKLNFCWILHVIHGFVGQSIINILGRAIPVTLIARRSNRFAGTRFLKRGINAAGFVANFVETEQIVFDETVSNLLNGRFTSFVQVRGSVPVHWAQDVTKIVAKPPINIELKDPFFESTGKHFNRLLKAYGAPIILLNLVKKRERKKQERLLSDELGLALQYLNQFVPSPFYINVINFDMARLNKQKEAKVMDKLERIAKDAISKMGFFRNRREFCARQSLFSNSWSMQSSSSSSDSVRRTPNRKGVEHGYEQTGVIRTNCVDCLDRTNTAQFAIGKCALGYQLHYLGVLENKKLEYDTDCIRILESLYEDHGDTLALQYGGSQLVHRIKTYRKLTPWTSQGNDIMQTLSRYYSNTFSDNEKQNTINLFLGVYRTDVLKEPIWDLVTDFYLHNSHAAKSTNRTSLTQWWSDDVLENLPLATYDSCVERVDLSESNDRQNDLFVDYYRTHQYVTFNDTHCFLLKMNFINFVPKNATNPSPFTVRVHPGRKYEDYIKSNTVNDRKISYPSLIKQIEQTSSSSSSSSSPSSSSSSNDSDSTATVLKNNSSLTMSPVSDDDGDNVTNEDRLPFHTHVTKTNSNWYVSRTIETSVENRALYSLYVKYENLPNATSIERFYANLRNQLHAIKVPQQSIALYSKQVLTTKWTG